MLINLLVYLVYKEKNYEKKEALWCDIKKEKFGCQKVNKCRFTLHLWLLRQLKVKYKMTAVYSGYIFCMKTFLLMFRSKNETMLDQIHYDCRDQWTFII